MDDFFIPENDRNLHKTGASLNAILLSFPLQIYIGLVLIARKHLFFSRVYVGMAQLEGLVFIVQQLKQTNLCFQGRAEI